MEGLKTKWVPERWEVPGLAGGPWGENGIYCGVGDTSCSSKAGRCAFREGGGSRQNLEAYVLAGKKMSCWNLDQWRPRASSQCLKHTYPQLSRALT